MSINTTTDRILDRSRQGIDESLGKCGAQMLEDASEVTGKFRAIQFISETAITTAGTLTLSGKTIPAGIVLYGEFTSVTPAAGDSVIVYNAC